MLAAAIAGQGKRLSPLDGRDFNRCFPGDPFGGFAMSTWQMTYLTKDFGFWQIFMPQ